MADPKLEPCSSALSPVAFCYLYHNSQCVGDGAHININSCDLLKKKTTLKLKVLEEYVILLPCCLGGQ